MKRKILKLAICIIMMFTFIVNINAFNQKTGIVGNGNNSPAWNGYNKFVFLKADGLAAFCTLYYADLPGKVNNGCQLSDSWPDEVKAGIAAIINKANVGNSNMTKEYYYADLAMNEFLYYYNGQNINNGISKKRGISTEQVLKDGSNNHMEYYNAATSAYFKVKKGVSTKLTRTDGKSTWYLPSGTSGSKENKYKITGDADYYEVSIPALNQSNGLTLTITDENGQTRTGNKFISGESFKIKIDGIQSNQTLDTKYTINVTGIMEYQVATNYTCGTGKQEITLNQTETSRKTGSVSTTIAVKKGKAPEPNEPEEPEPIYPKLVIEKKNSAEPYNSLTGAELLITKNGEKFDQLITDEKTSITLEDLQPGRYCVKEVRAPIGYNILLNKEYCFTVNEPNESNGYVAKITDLSAENMANDDENHIITISIPNNKNVIKIIKVDENDNPMSGIQLSIKQFDGKDAKTIDNTSLDNLTTTNTPIKIRGLAPGLYYLVEEEVPEGYAKSHPIPFTVEDNTTTDKVEDGENLTVEVKMKNKKTVVNINKVDITNGQSIKGAELEIRDGNCENVIELDGQPVRWTSDGTSHTIIGLQAGNNYCLKETKAPDGYKIMNNGETKFKLTIYGGIEIPDEEETEEKEKDPTTIIIANEYNNVYISKQDITTKQELPGAHLIVTDQDGNTIKDGDWISTTEPHLLKALNPGTYTITEVTAPDGYTRNEESITFTVDNNGAISGNTIMYNTPIPEVPNTLSMQSILVIVIGLLLIAGGTCLYIYGSKKKKAS